MGDLENRISEVSKAPRVTEADVLNSIASCFFVTAYDAALNDRSVPVVGAEKIVPKELKVVTLAIVTNKAGFTVIGVSGCADPKNFNAEIGEEIAKRNAVSQLWGHMGFVLREKLHEQETKRVSEKQAEDDMSAMPHAIGSMDE